MQNDDQGVKPKVEENEGSALTSLDVVLKVEGVEMQTLIQLLVHFRQVALHLSQPRHLFLGEVIGIPDIVKHIGYPSV